MTDHAPMRFRRRGVLCGFGLSLVLLPAVFLAAANLWFASPPARAWIERKLHDHLATRVHVERMSVWPWSGITLHWITVDAPTTLEPTPTEPLATFESLCIEPQWLDWLKGRRNLRAIEINAAHLRIPIELLGSAALGRTPPVAAMPSQPPATSQPPAVQPPSTSSPPAVAMPAPTEAPAVLTPTAWIHLNDCSLEITSIHKPGIDLKITGINGSIPAAGKEAASSLAIAAIQCADTPVSKDLRCQLKWKAPQLTMEPMDCEVLGLKTRLVARAQFSRALPLEVALQLPEQPLAEFPLMNQARASADRLSVRARFIGLALAPASWQGECVTELLAPLIRWSDRTIPFQQGRAILVMRGPNLSCVDARLVSDDVSLLGNATLLGDGRIAANARLVASPEYATNAVHRFLPNIDVPLTPLSSPQRVAFDVMATGTLRQMQFSLGSHGPMLTIPH